MSQWEKLIAAILKKNKNLRFEDLRKALLQLGFAEFQSRGGSSHYIYRKAGSPAITLPKQAPMNHAYIELVSNAVQHCLESEEGK